MLQMRRIFGLWEPYKMAAQTPEIGTNWRVFHEEEAMAILTKLLDGGRWNCFTRWAYRRIWQRSQDLRWIKIRKIIVLPPTNRLFQRRKLNVCPERRYDTSRLPVILINMMTRHENKTIRIAAKRRPLRRAPNRSMYCPTEYGGGTQRSAKELVWTKQPSNSPKSIGIDDCKSTQKMWHRKGSKELKKERRKLCGR